MWFWIWVYRFFFFGVWFCWILWIWNPHSCEQKQNNRSRSPLNFNLNLKISNLKSQNPTCTIAHSVISSHQLHENTKPHINQSSKPLWWLDKTIRGSKTLDSRKLAKKINNSDNNNILAWEYVHVRKIRHCALGCTLTWVSKGKIWCSSQR